MLRDIVPRSGRDESVNIITVCMANARANSPSACFLFIITLVQAHTRDASLPARKRANETAPVLSQCNRAPQFSTCAPNVHVRRRVCGSSRARCSIALSCVRRDSLARAYALHWGAAYRPARNYAAFAARARYERRRASVCAWERVYATRRDIAFHGRCFEFYISGERFDENEIYIFFTNFICNTVKVCLFKRALI